MCSLNTLVEQRDILKDKYHQCTHFLERLTIKKKIREIEKMIDEKIKEMYAW